MTAGKARIGAALGRRRFAAACLAVGALALAGCGDDETETTTQAPAAETTTEAPEPTTTTDTGTEPTTTTTTGTGSSGGAYDPEADTEGNDIPPPPGSAAERFEERCDKNPESCS